MEKKFYDTRQTRSQAKQKLPPREKTYFDPLRFAEDRGPLGPQDLKSIEEAIKVAHLDIEQEIKTIESRKKIVLPKLEEGKMRLMDETVPLELKPFFYTDREPPDLLQDYDVIGFAVDHCLVKFNVKQMHRLAVKAIMTDLWENNHKDYPESITYFNFNEHERMFLNNAVWDINTGCILRLSEDQMEITYAVRGFKKLEQHELQRLYGNPPRFKNLSFPKQNRMMEPAKEAHWVMTGFFDCLKVPIICHVIDLMLQREIKNKTYHQFAYDLAQAEFDEWTYHEDTKVHEMNKLGRIYPVLASQPDRYIQPQPQLCKVLQTLRDFGKQTFLTCNNHVQYVELVMENTLGAHWQNYFDIIMCNCKKPLFHKFDNPFFRLNKSKLDKRGEKYVTPQEIRNFSFKMLEKKIFLEGNAAVLTGFFQQFLATPNLKVAYFGSNYFNDIFPIADLNRRLKGDGSLASWDAIAVIEEYAYIDKDLQNGTEANLIVPDEKYWGESYFFDAVSSEMQELKGICKTKPRNYFLAEIEKVTRYAVGFVKNIDRLVQPQPVVIDRPQKKLIKTLGLCHSTMPKVEEGRFPEMQHAENNSDDGLQMPGGLQEPSPTRSISKEPDFTKDELTQQLLAQEESRQLLPQSDSDHEEKQSLNREPIIDDEFQSLFNATDQKYQDHEVFQEEKELQELQELEMEKDDLIGQLEGQKVQNMTAEGEDMFLNEEFNNNMMEESVEQEENNSFFEENDKIPSDFEGEYDQNQQPKQNGEFESEANQSKIKVEKLDDFCWQGHDSVFRIGSPEFNVTVSSYGASLLSVKLKGSHSKELTLNHMPDREERPNEDIFCHVKNNHFGATCGRVAGQISSEFKLPNGVECSVTQNDTEKCVNGGIEGFSRVEWDVAQVLVDHTLELTVDNQGEQKTGNGVKFSRISTDYEEGFPGKLQVEQYYIVTEQKELYIQTKAWLIEEPIAKEIDSEQKENEQTKMTPINICNNTFWNLSGDFKERTIKNHEIRLPNFSRINVPEGKMTLNEGVDLGFQDYKKISNILGKVDEGKPGIYLEAIIDEVKPNKLQLMAELQNGKTLMKVYSTQQAVTIQTQTQLQSGDMNQENQPLAAIGLRTSDAADDVIQNALKMGEVYQHTTVHKFESFHSETLQNHQPENTISLESRVDQIQCQDQWSKLTQDEKQYSYFMSQAVWEGSKTKFFQSSYESPALFVLFQLVFAVDSFQFSYDPVQELKQKALCLESVNISEKEFDQFLAYVACFYHCFGNYSNGQKFVPELSCEKFVKICKASKAYSEDKNALVIDKLFANILYEVYSEQNSLLGFPDQGGATSSYSSNISLLEATRIKEFCTKTKICQKNSVLLKSENGQYFTLLVSSALVKTPWYTEYKLEESTGLYSNKKVFKEGTTLRVQCGNHTQIHMRLIDFLHQAKQHRSHETQEKVINQYIEHLKYREMKHYKNVMKQWVKVQDSLVQYHIGFSSNLQDPLDLTNQWQAFVGIKEKEKNSKVQALLNRFQELTEKLPWQIEFDEKLLPSVENQNAIAFAQNDGLTSMQQPHYDDIKETKLINFENCFHKSKSVNFLTKEDNDLLVKYSSKTRPFMTVLSGLFGEGTRKFKSLLVDHQNVISHEEFKTKFGPLSHAYEYARCQGVALHMLNYEVPLQTFFPRNQDEWPDLQYAAWLDFISQAIHGLRFHIKKTEWTDSKSQANWALLMSILLEAPEVIKVQLKENQFEIKIDRAVLNASGLILSTFLNKLHVFKVVGDEQKGKEFFEKYSKVPQEWLQVQSFIKSKKEIKSLFVQPNITETLMLQQYEPSFAGIIYSFSERFQSQAFQSDVYSIWLKTAKQMRSQKAKLACKQVLKKVELKQSLRPLHWVIKVSDLKSAVRIFEVLGARVLRHEEFDTKCDANCNGDFKGRWSKTMVGWANEDTSFVLELTYTHEVQAYDQGNQLNGILMHGRDQKGQEILEKLMEIDTNLLKDQDGWCSMLNGELKFKFQDSQADTNQLLIGLDLKSNEPEASCEYFKSIGMELEKGALTCLGYPYFKLYLSETGEKIVKGNNYGRLAFSCDTTDIDTLFKKSESEVITAPVTLKTKGKADVLVTILASPAGHELCFVNDSAFRELSKETGAQIDWEKYEKEEDSEQQNIEYKTEL